MSSQTHTQKKQPTSMAASPVGGLAQHRFRVQPKLEDEDAVETAEAPTLQDQLHRAEKFGHHLGQINGSSSVAIAQPKAASSQPMQRVAGEEEEEMQAKADGKSTAIAQPKAVSSQPMQRVAGEEEEEMQAKADGLGKLEPLIQRQALPNFGATGAGRSLPKGVRTKMEKSFGSSFSDVQVHTDSMQAKAVGALAYTQGNNVHFAPGQYNPQTMAGQALLGHELTHVVQQRAGRVPVPAQSKGAPINADPALEHEADVMGAKAARGEAAQVPGAVSVAQRKDDSEQAQPVQNSNQPVQFFLAMLLPMLMPLIQQMLPQILTSVMGAGAGGGGGGGGR